MGNNFFVKTSAPEPVPIKKIKEEPKQQRVVETKRPVAKQTYREEYKKIEPTIQLESYYYGILPKESNNDSGVPVSFNVKVNIFFLQKVRDERVRNYCEWSVSI